MDVAGDAELAARVDAHRERRGPDWTTAEAGGDLPAVVRAAMGTVLVDSLGPWVARAPDDVDADALCRALVERAGDTVLVSDEVGLAVHPSTREGRLFRDALGAVNARVSAVADRAYLVVAGRALLLPPPGAPT
jgi:adenosyl cobinamide kinase/adenosyl cobinamide phosphate guanylyltransferase